MNQSGISAVTERTVSNQGTSRRLSLAANLLSYGILAGGATTIVLAIYVAALGHSKLPFWDEWVQIDFAANEGSGHTLDWLWRQYNKHRFVIPKLFLLADLRWFRATQTSLIVSNLTLQFLQLCLLSWSMRVLGGWRGPLWRTAVGLLAFCLFCPSQWPNLVMGITGLAFYLPPLFASLSFVGLLLYWRHTRAVDDRSPSWKYLLLSVAAGVCATYSLSNGNLVWPLLLLGAVLLRLRIAAMSALALGAAVTISAFFYNYTVYVTTSALHSRGELVGLLKYIAAYFGSSWVTNDISRAEMLGIAGALPGVHPLADCTLLPSLACHLLAVRPPPVVCAGHRDADRAGEICVRNRPGIFRPLPIFRPALLVLHGAASPGQVGFTSSGWRFARAGPGSRRHRDAVRRAKNATAALQSPMAWLQPQSRIPRP